MEWISVKDRLPEKGIWVVVLHKELPYHYSAISPCVAKIDNQNEWFTAFLKMGEITHWMPLPPAPKDV